jgi:hypothetical protein
VLSAICAPKGNTAQPQGFNPGFNPGNRISPAKIARVMPPIGRTDLSEGKDEG